MTARELLAKATVVSHSYIKRAIRHQQLPQVVPFTFQAVQKVCKTIANLSTESLDAVRVLVYALVKEYARPYETLRERAAVRDFSLVHYLSLMNGIEDDLTLAHSCMQYTMLCCLVITLQGSRSQLRESSVACRSKPCSSD
jgi:hypothetical protein